METFVVPDLHGRTYLAQGLLEKAGIIDAAGDRIDDPKVRVVQVGDLANCVARDATIDVEILGRAEGWFDVLLVGNHELPYLGGPSFGGFWHVTEVASALLALDWQPCLAVGGTLLTHAGVVPEMLAAATAEEAARELRLAWIGMRARHPFFSQIGRARGGWHDFGGCTWSDALMEPRDLRFSQVHGHTPNPTGPTVSRSTAGTFSINLDVGGHGDTRRIVGLWLDEEGLAARDPFVEFVYDGVFAGAAS